MAFILQYRLLKTSITVFNVSDVQRQPSDDIRDLMTYITAVLLMVTNCEFTMYIGEPHNVAAITPSSRNRANPKSPVDTQDIVSSLKVEEEIVTVL